MMISSISRSHRQQGLSMVELLVAVAIGLLLMAGLTMVFVNSSEASRELQKSAQQIENGRYATDILTQDLRHAGYYGHFYNLPTPPASLPDPCELTDLNALLSALAYPIQGYRAPDFNTVANVAGTSCTGLLPTSNLRRGSDVLVIRRASTQLVSPTSSTTNGDLYIQASATHAEVQIGNGAVLGNNKANGSPSVWTLKDGVTPVPVRKYVVHVYFVAPCSKGTGTNGVCQTSDDSIPTLKRLELVSNGSNALFRIVPLVEGIEIMKLEYGRDTVPATTSTITNVSGDSTVDIYEAAPADADWPSVIATKVYLLARNNDPSHNHVDDKSYVLGSVTLTPANYAGETKFKRHVFTASVRLNNPSGRREIP